MAACKQPKTDDDMPSPNNPIVTVKLASVSLDKGDGPDVRVKIKIDDGPVIERIGPATNDRWLFQAPYTSSTINAHIDVSEVDPVYTESTSSDKTITLKVDNLPQKGSDSTTVTLKAVGGDKGKSATYKFAFDWFVSSNVEDLAAYIQQKMVSNLKGAAFAKIQEAESNAQRLAENSTKIYFGMGGNSDMALAAGSLDADAMRRFYDQVKYGGDWDYKADIQTTYGDWALDASRGRKYKFDIWANIHYGYIGKAVGFSDDILLDAAGAAQAIHDGKYKDLFSALADGDPRKLDEPGDQPAIIIGFGLWKRFGPNVTTQNILDAIRGPNASRIHTAPADEGTPPDSLQSK